MESRAEAAEAEISIAEQAGWEKCKLAITTFFRMKAATLGEDQLSKICNAWGWLSATKL